MAVNAKKKPDFFTPLKARDKLRTLLSFIVLFGLIGLILLVRSYAAAGNVLGMKDYNAANSDYARIITETDSTSKKNTQVVELENGTITHAKWQTNSGQILTQGTYRFCLNARVPSSNALGDITVSLGGDATPLTRPYAVYESTYTQQNSKEYLTTSCVNNVVAAQDTSFFTVVVTNQGSAPIRIGSIIYTKSPQPTR